MENLSGYTPTELLKMINDMKAMHDVLKQEIIDHTYQVDELEGIINNKLDELTSLEKNYIELIEELNKR
jgi:uncharacterized coiled-coil DUF342 family protein